MNKNIVFAIAWLFSAAVSIFFIVYYIVDNDKNDDSSGSEDAVIDENDGENGYDEDVETSSFHWLDVISTPFDPATEHEIFDVYMDLASDYTGRSMTNSTLQPYIICNTNEGSSWDRLNEIREVFQVSGDDDDVSLIMSEESYSCFIAGLTQGFGIGDDDIASAVDDEIYPYIPLTPILKLRNGFTDEAYTPTAEGEKQILLQTCPYFSMDDNTTVNLEMFGLTSGEMLDDFIDSYWIIDEDFLNFVLPLYGDDNDAGAFLNILSDSFSSECAYVYDSGEMYLETASPNDLVLHLPENTDPICAIQIATPLTAINEVCSVERKVPTSFSNR